jgi:hypothetical protein
VFWSLSLPEWRALLAPRRTPSLDRAGLEALMTAFPD